MKYKTLNDHRYLATEIFEEIFMYSDVIKNIKNDEGIFKITTKIEISDEYDYQIVWRFIKKDMREILLTDNFYIDPEKIGGCEKMKSAKEGTIDVTIVWGYGENKTNGSAEIDADVINYSLRKALDTYNRKNPNEDFDNQY